MQHAAFAQPDHPAAGVGLDVFEDALLARLAGVSLGVGVEVVGVDLELHGPDGAERVGFDDRHVVCGADRRAADVAAGRPADIGRSGLDLAENGLHEPLLLHLPGQSEGVAAAHADRLGLADEGCGILLPVDRPHPDPQLRETGLHLLLILGVGEGHCGVGDEGDFADTLQEPSDFGKRVAQVLLPGIGRIGDQKQFHKYVYFS